VNDGEERPRHKEGVPLTQGAESESEDVACMNSHWYENRDDWVVRDGTRDGHTSSNKGTAGLRGRTPAIAFPAIGRSYLWLLREMNVQGIILAGGLSTRMGAEKLLLKLDGTPVLLWVVRAALESSLQRVILVTGPRRELSAVCAPVESNPRLRRITNPLPEQGMSSSLRLGLSRVSDDAAGALILLADQPRVTAEVIDELLRVFGQDHSRIVLPTISGRRTTPVLFPSDLFPQLLATEGDIGGRLVVDHNLARVVTVEMRARYDDADLDTMEDFESMTRKMRRERPDKE
jgi:molybdenum cofactor cytidylyltransferase